MENKKLEMKVTSNNRWEPPQDVKLPCVGTVECSINSVSAQDMARHVMNVESWTTFVKWVKVYREKQAGLNLRSRLRHKVQQDENTNWKNKHIIEDKNIDVLALNSLGFKVWGQL